MRLLLIVHCLVASVASTALTFKLGANDKECFYEKVHEKNAKVAFYFAVQAGGNFDIDYTVNGPTGKDIVDGEKERQGDYVFTASEPGEYKFCFNNDMSSFSEKTVDLEISVENAAKAATLPAKQGSSPEQMSVLEESIAKISSRLGTITRNQKYFRTRENRNMSTVKSTEGRIFSFAIVEGGMMVTMAALQVFIVKFFFQGARKGYV